MPTIDDQVAPGTQPFIAEQPFDQLHPTASLSNLQGYQGYVDRSGPAPKKHRSVLLVGIIIAVVSVGSAGAWFWHYKNHSAPVTSNTPTSKSKSAKPAPGPQITSGVAATLGPGTFTVGTGKDVVPGLYAVSPGPQQSGNFDITSSAGNFSVILDNIAADPYGTNTAWTLLAAGDKLQLSGDRLKTATFTPVLVASTDPPILAKLYNGSFNVSATDTRGIAPGRHLAYSNPGATGDILVISKDYRIKYSRTLDHTGFMVDLAEGDRVAGANLDAINFGPTQ